MSCNRTIHINVTGKITATFLTHIDMAIITHLSSRIITVRLIVFKMELICAY